MNPALPLTRRDVVVVVSYVVLAYNVLSPLLTLVARFVLGRLPWLQIPPGSGMFLDSAITLGIAFVFSLAFVPFVSLMASGATGRSSSEKVAKHGFLPLIFSCAGLMLLLTSLPQFGLTICYYLMASTFYGRSASMVRPILLQSMALSLVFVSFGFALAFFPAIFAGLRFRVRDEEAAI